MPRFPQDDVQFLNKKDNEIRYYHTPQTPGGPFTYIKSEPLDLEKVYDICVKAGYEMQLSDYAKNLQQWGQAHCK